MKLTPCLYFKGSCEAALRFYESCGLGEITELRCFAGTPMEARDGAAWSDKVLFSIFEGPWVRLIASDGPDSEPMKGCALFVEDADTNALGKLFVALSEGGRITVPWKRQFWGSWYGNFTDRFGVQWALSEATDAHV